MTLSAQNVTLDYLGADLRPVQPEPKRDHIPPDLGADKNPAGAEWLTELHRRAA